MEQWLESMEQWFDSVEQWLEMMLANSSGMISMIVIFATIAVAAFVVTMLVVKSSE